MVHKEDIYAAASLLLKSIQKYDDNHPEVIPKSMIAEVIIKKIAKISAGSYYEGIGILQESAGTFNQEWNEGNDLEDFSEAERDEEED